MITNIDVNKIDPHPDNPRKDLGDLSELVESIKSNGILQNLTVVPWFSEITRAPADNGEMDDEYRVVIGHRRLAAAKLAGLSEVTCVISDMDQRTQVATMMLENMQRSDLTVYEQAQGMQLMLNLGETVETISEKTGFSKSTVRHRVKMLELDPEKFKDGVIRGASLLDFMELESIKDPELKNKVLSVIGTANFNYELKRAKDKEKENKRLAGVIEQLNTFADRTEDISGLRYVKYISLYYGDAEFEIPEDAGKREYFYEVSKYGSVSLYSKPTDQEIKQDNENKLSMKDYNQKKANRKKLLDEISDRSFQLRNDFMKNIKNLKKKSRDIMEFAVRSILLCGWDDEFEWDMLYEFIGKKSNDEDEEENCFKDVSDAFGTDMEKMLLIIAYCNGMCTSGVAYYDWDGNYRSNEKLDLLYEYLKKLGYEISDEEQSLKDGTHELYAGIE